ncbi:MAG TPA: glycosyltransferase family 39 protein, partial [Lentimicrobium sp.]|nr:glycosyltransferase family 39 protein [Lentimicrobium sp.]
MTADFLKKYRLWILLLVSAISRLFIAAFTELGNDEVYYINYALFPDLSHFDHPPMVGWFIQLFSLNLLFENEFFIRLGAVVAGTLNTWAIYLIGKKIKDAQTGWYAALLYTSSFYCFVIAGIFIMPDAPQSLFWLFSVYFLLTIAKEGPLSSKAHKAMLGFGISAGLAMLSKYTSVFLFTGAGIYIIIFQQRWLRQWQLYATILISLLLFLPVIIWNLHYNFISFTFHSDRVEVIKTILRPDLFAIELGGQIFYNNPINFALTLLGLTAFFRGKLTEQKAEMRMLIS